MTISWLLTVLWESKSNFGFICDVNSISKFMGSYIPYNIHWVQIDMNHALPHSLMMLPLPRFIYAFKKKGGHKSLQIVH